MYLHCLNPTYPILCTSQGGANDTLERVWFRRFDLDMTSGCLPFEHFGDSVFRYIYVQHREHDFRSTV